MTFIYTAANTLRQLQDKPILYPLFKEVVGCNTPKTLVARNANERVDVATGQFGGTVCFFGSGLLLDKLLKPLYDNVLANKRLVPNPRAAQGWTRLGKSFSIYALQGALYWAVPHFRNYITVKRSRTDDFLKMVSDNNQKPVLKLTDNQIKAKEKEHLKMVRNIVLGGAAVSAASVLGSISAIKKGLALNAPAKFLLRHLALGGGSFKNYPRWAEFFFIAGASYVGWIHATRDKYELKEQLLQFATFLFGWFVPPIAIEKHYKNKLEKLVKNKELFNKVIGYDSMGRPNTRLNLDNIRKHLAKNPALRQSAEKMFVSQFALGMGVSIGLLSILPQVLNIYLTQKRVEKDKLAEQLKSAAENPHKTMMQSAMERVFPSPVVKPMLAQPIALEPSLQRYYQNMQAQHSNQLV